MFAHVFVNRALPPTITHFSTCSASLVSYTKRAVFAHPQSELLSTEFHLMHSLRSKAMAVFDYLREALSEFMATCAFVFLMCGTGLSTRDPNNSADIDLTAHFAVSLANGLAASLVIFAFGNISGAHFNPVVSASLYALGKLSLIRLVMYSAAQFAGGLFGAALLKGVFPAGTGSYPFPNQAGLGHTELTPNVSLANGWMCELLITFTLVFTALRVAVDPVNYVRDDVSLFSLNPSRLTPLPNRVNLPR